MNAATVSNTPPRRKQLADQLDRLDSILDALSDGLNGAVAEAAREGTRLAVQGAIVEILTDPNLRAQLHQATAPTPMPEAAASQSKPGLWAHLQAKAHQAVKAVGHFTATVADAVLGRVKAVADAVRGGARAVVETARDAVRAVTGRGRVRTLVVVGLSVGLALGVTAYIAPHTVAAALSGISGAVTAAAMQIGVWTRRTVRALSLL